MRSTRSAPDHPVILTTLTGHAVLMNSAALAKAGIREDQKDPVGGRYERSAAGKLTGVLREYAVLNLERKLGTMPSDAEATEQLREFFAQAVRFGITTTQDMSDAIEPGRAVKLFEATPTPIRIRIMRMPGTTPAGRDTREGLSVPHHPSALITVDGTKWLLDGVPLENTLTPRKVPSVPAGELPDYGVRHLPLTFSEKEMEAMLRESLANGGPLMFHTSGYPSAAAMLDAMDATGGKKSVARQARAIRARRRAVPGFGSTREGNGHRRGAESDAFRSSLAIRPRVAWVQGKPAVSLADRGGNSGGDWLGRADESLPQHHDGVH